jgi:hypothetical protein
MARESEKFAAAGIPAGRHPDRESTMTASLRTYRVKILSPSGDVVEEHEVRASTPEDAARRAVNEELVRGEKGSDRLLRAKVYWSLSGTPTTMVRLYAKRSASALPGNSGRHDASD